MTAPSTDLDLSNPTAAYERWLVEPLFRPFAVTLIEATGVISGDRVLDVACGTGIVARLANERAGHGGGVVGIDSSGAMLAVARQVEPAIEWREGNAMNLPLNPDERFDVVLCHQGLQFVSDRAAAIRQMLSALASGGRIGIGTWSAVTDGFLHDLHLIAEQRLGPIIDRRHIFGEEGMMRELLAAAGLQSIRVETVSRRVTFPDPTAFLRLNSRALVGMSMRATTLSDGSRNQIIAQLVAESAEAAAVHTTADGLTFSISSLLATARR